MTELDLVPYLVRALKILNAMANEGVGIEGEEWPEDVLYDLSEKLGFNDWEEMIIFLQSLK